MMRRGLRVLLVGLLVAQAMVASGFGPPTLIESDSAARPVTSRILRAIGADQPPEVTARAAVVVDATTGQVVYEKNARERRAQASTTKMMTALVTLENARLDEIVTAGPNALVEPSIIGLEVGDQLTVEQMLYGLLLTSGNDAAVALAEHVGGSIPEFVAMMNARAAELGLMDTQFANPHGLDAEGHYSSARDVALLARAAMENPVFERIVATREHRVEGPPRWQFKNLNRQLGVYPGADGVKTGYTDNAGRCLAFSATRNGHRAIAVVLDSADTYSDTAALLDYFFANYSWETLSVADIPMTDYGQGDNYGRATAKSSPHIVFPAWQEPYLRWFFSVSAGPAPESGAAGLVTYYLFGKKVAEIELRAEGN